MKGPWGYLKFMAIGAFVCGYYDWYRRVNMETLLKLEEKNLRYCISIFTYL